LSSEFQQLTNLVTEKLMAMDLERQSFNKAFVTSNASNVLELVRLRCQANGVHAIGIPTDVAHIGPYVCSVDG
jgi:hypothetical protein